MHNTSAQQQGGQETSHRLAFLALEVTAEYKAYSPGTKQPAGEANRFGRFWVREACCTRFPYPKTTHRARAKITYTFRRYEHLTGSPIGNAKDHLKRMTTPQVQE